MPPAKKTTDDTEETGYPVGAFIGVGAEATHVDGVEYKVDPETGYVTGKA